MQKRMDFIVGFALWEHKTQNDQFIGGRHFDQAAFISECASVEKCPVGTAGKYVSVGAMWYQEGGWLERRRGGRI